MRSQEGNDDMGEGSKAPEVEIVEELSQPLDKIQETSRGGVNKIQVYADGIQQKKMKISHISQASGRASTRVAGTGTPIPLRAERRADWADNKDKNHNSFAVLQNIDNEVLAKVARDCSIILGETKDEIDACVDLIKAKELAQATLAEADKKREATQSTVESLEVMESEDEHTEDHGRLLQDLKVSVTLVEEVNNVEVVREALKESILDKPK